MKKAIPTALVLIFALCFVFPLHTFAFGSEVFAKLMAETQEKNKDSEDCVTLYDKPNYTGKYFVSCPVSKSGPGNGNPDLSIAPKAYNVSNKVSSVKLGSNVSKAVLWDEKGYRGAHITITTSIPDLKTKNFDNKMESLTNFLKENKYGPGPSLEEGCVILIMQKKGQPIGFLEVRSNSAEEEPIGFLAKSNRPLRGSVSLCHPMVNPFAVYCKERHEEA